MMVFCSELPPFLRLNRDIQILQELRIGYFLFSIIFKTIIHFFCEFLYTWLVIRIKKIACN